MKDGAIRTELADLRISSIFFDESFLPERKEKGKTRSPEHRHSDYEIFFIVRGTLSVKTKRRQIRADNGTIVILAPGTDHETELEISQGYCMYFNLEKKPKSGGELYEKIHTALQNPVTVLPLNADEQFYLERLAKAAEHPLSAEYEEHLIPLLFRELIEKIIPRPSSREKKKRTRTVNLIDRYINEHYREKIRLSDLSRALYLCPKQISRVLRKEYGCSLPDLIHQRRLDLARTMLRESDAEIGQIAQRVGYEYENYFYTLFRKTYGMTPGEYREKKDE